MQYDEIIDCPKSGGDLCYRVEITKDITNYFSLSCGFMTNSLMTSGSEFLEETNIGLPELHKDIAWTDPDTGLVWVPNTINNPDQGMVLPMELIKMSGAGQQLNLKKLKIEKKVILSIKWI